jgi:hypothetical protein
MARKIPRRVNRSRPHRMGSRSLSDYDLGWDLWLTGKPLPLGASRNTQQGYVNAAKSADRFLVSCMREQARRGLFRFLDRFSHLAPDSGKPLSCGAESRYQVRYARSVVAQVKAAAFVG